MKRNLMVIVGVMVVALLSVACSRAGAQEDAIPTEEPVMTNEDRMRVALCEDALERRREATEGNIKYLNGRDLSNFFKDIEADIQTHCLTPLGIAPTPDPESLLEDFLSIGRDEE